MVENFLEVDAPLETFYGFLDSSWRVGMMDEEYQVDTNEDCYTWIGIIFGV